jgi:hypothetical protein
VKAGVMIIGSLPKYVEDIKLSWGFIRQIVSRFYWEDCAPLEGFLCL